jgi:hypothetical protein
VQDGGKMAAKFLEGNVSVGVGVHPRHDGVDFRAGKRTWGGVGLTKKKKKSTKNSDKTEE